MVIKPRQIPLIDRLVRQPRDGFAFFSKHGFFSFLAVGHKKLSHACGGSPLLQVYLLVLDCTMKRTHTFPTVCSSFSCGMMVSRYVSLMTADHEEGRGDGTNHLWGAAQALSHGSGVDTGGAG
jgi:hypothetical protein